MAVGAFRLAILLLQPFAGMPDTPCSGLKQVVDTVLKHYVQGEKSIPGLVYKAVDRRGRTVYEGCEGVESMDDPDEKVRVQKTYC